MTTTYIVTEAFAASVLEIKNPWFIVNADYVVGVYAGRTAARAAKAAGWNGKIVSLNEIVLAVSKDEDSKPVSYTHLDVYKRQLLETPGGVPFLG